MRIGIIGGGSIGLLIASYLSEKHTMTIYVRRECQKQTINKEGLFMTGVNEKRYIKTLLLDELKNEDLIIICVKQTQLADVIEELHNRGRMTPLLFLQNGMGHIKYLKDIPNPIFIGVVEHGAIRENDNKVKHTGKGIIYLASYNQTEQALEKLVKQLNRTKFPIHRSSDWEKLLKEKLIINAVINPLTGLFNVENGLIISDTHLRFIAENICKEASQTLKLNNEIQWMRIKSIAEKTSENTSSMLMDIKENRITEIESILGYLIEQSQKEIPYTLFVYHGIKVLEVNKGFYQ